MGPERLRLFLQSRLPYTGRHLAILAYDTLMAGLCFVFAVFLRYGSFDLREDRVDAIYQGAPLFALIAAACFIIFGVYRHVWRYSSTDSMVQIIRAVTTALFIFVAVTFVVDRVESIPRSTPVILWFVLMVTLGGSRMLYRGFAHRRLNGADRLPILVIGADQGAAMFLRALEADTGSNYKPVGILDRSINDRGRYLHNVPVLGYIGDLKRISGQLTRRGQAVQRLVVTDTLPPDVLRQLMADADDLNMQVSQAPSITELKEAGESHKLTLKPMALQDLLGRSEAELDLSAIIELVKGRKVVITGAGGSIGSELVRQIVLRHPASLLLIENSEYNLYEIDRELATLAPDLPREAMLANIRDRSRIFKIFLQRRPDLVFHAAALKHVPMVEMNPGEGVLTNAIGTRNVADAAKAAKALAMVQISTDKAVKPTNIMGAAKRLAEYYCQALDIEAKREFSMLSGHIPTRFITVRFGNVLGSSGSVVPLFQKQLAAGGPLTVTHPHITRYFMTIREAVELVLQATAYGVRHEEDRGQIFVLDMGEPVKIVDVARNMIRLAGFDPEKEIGIEFVGLRPGEKLYEELFDPDEKRLESVVSGVFAASSESIPIAQLQIVFEHLQEAARQGDEARLRRTIAEIIPGYVFSQVVAA